MKKPPRIGVLIGTKKSKKEYSVLLRLAVGLKKAGADVVILYFSGSTMAHLAEKLNIERVNIREFNKSYDFSGPLSFRKAIKKAKIDTVLFRDHRETAILVTAKFLMKGKLRLVYCQAEALAQMKRDFLHTFRFNQLDAWITPYPSTALEVKSETNLDHERLHVFPIPVAGKSASSIKLKVGSRDTADFAVGFNLNSEKWDELHQLIAATLLLKARGLGISLRIGVDADKDHHEQYRLKLLENEEYAGLTESVKVQNLRRADGAFWTNIDAMFINMHSAPFDGVCERALGFGIPCIALNTMLSNDIFANGKAAMLCKRDQPEELADNIASLILKEEIRKELSTKAETLHKAEFSMKKFSHNILNLLKALQ